MKVRFWGVRGSIPAPGERTYRIGGNTACIQLVAGGGFDDVVILDAGTGIRELGLGLNSQPPKRIHILLSHTHWDHIQGLPFFRNLYIPNTTISVYGPRGLDNGLEEAVMVLMQRLWFPVRRGDLAAKVSFFELGEDNFSLGPLVISTKYMNHPVLTLAYSVTHQGRRMVYTGDHEPFDYYHVYARSNLSTVKMALAGKEREKRLQQLIEFISGANLLITDSQYTDEEYKAKLGWGHSPVSYSVDLATKANVGAMALFHHDPIHSDDELSKLESVARGMLKSRGLPSPVVLAREGETIEV